MSSRDESLPVSPDGSARSYHSADDNSSGRTNSDQPHKSASGRPRESSSSKTSAKSWHRRASRPVSLWLAAIIILALAHPFVPNNRWMMVHFFTLGALMNSIMVWSQHFTEKFLHQRLPDSSRPRQVALIYALNVGVILCVIGQAFNDAARGAQGWAWIVVTVGAVIVGVAVAIHAISLISQWVKARRRAAKSNTDLGDYAAIVMFYIAASLILPIGAGLGATLAHSLPGTWHDRLIVMHMAVNVLGFVGLTAAGTLTILFPAIWRARVAAFRPVPTLAAMLGGILVLSIGTVSGRFELVGIGMVVYGAGWILCARPWAGIVRNSRRVSHEPPAIFARSSVVFAVIWVIGTMLVAGISQILNPDEIISTPTVPLVVGFGAQLLIGVMCYLLPSTMGGGGKAVSQGLATLDFMGPARTTMVNVGLILWVLPVGGWLHIVGSFAAGIGLAMFVPLAAVSAKNQVRAIRAQAAARRKKAGESAMASASSTDAGADAASYNATDTDTTGVHTGSTDSTRKSAGKPARAIPPNPPHSRSPLAQVAATMSAIALIACATLAITGSGSGSSDNSGGSTVAATGHTTSVTVTAKGMSFSPNSIDVPAGDRLKVTLKNEGDQVHDLKLADGSETGKVDPGESTTFTSGVITKKTKGWCTIPGHQMRGMELTVNTTGGSHGSAGANSTDSDSSGDTASDKDDVHASGHSMASTNTDSPLKPEVIRDPSVSPAPEGTTHNIDLTVSQVNRTIREDGTKRASWTFNGAPMGPVLRGRVGDEFVVHLKNDGSISHSIDFHAGMVSPDQPMRSIKPGESLEYRFRAEHAGIWLYHCGTAPISMHIAAGMFGAVIIDPPDLDPVDHEYIMVQSELYGLGKDKDNPVDSALFRSEQPSKVVFNGLENQYVQKPLELKHGERARFWLLNAGPNISESFHIVGTQFDTSFKEGSYTLRQGRDAFGVDDGGSQALDLLAAQGGFVEADFPEAGTYTMVNHQFADAERGAMGKIKVS